MNPFQTTIQLSSWYTSGKRHARSETPSIYFRFQLLFYFILLVNDWNSFQGHLHRVPSWPPLVPQQSFSHTVRYASFGMSTEHLFTYCMVWYQQVLASCAELEVTFLQSEVSILWTSLDEAFPSRKGKVVSNRKCTTGFDRRRKGAGDRPNTETQCSPTTLSIFFHFKTVIHLVSLRNSAKLRLK